MFADLVHLSVDDPPLRLLFLLFERLGVGLVSPSRLTCLRSEELEEGAPLRSDGTAEPRRLATESIAVFSGSLGEWFK